MGYPRLYSNCRFSVAHSAHSDRMEHMSAINTPPERLLVSAAEASARLGVSRSMVYALMAKGEIESVVIGKSRRIPVQALESFVDGLRSNPDSVG